jgi:hypothetical protein
MERIAPSPRIGDQVGRLVQDGLAGDVDQGELRGMLVRLGIQPLVQEFLERGQRDTLRVERYERSAERRGQRNGFGPTHLHSRRITAPPRLDHTCKGGLPA